MYISEHMKWRILLARTLREFHYERENSSRTYKRIFETSGQYLLGITYDTFLNYLNKDKYDMTGLRLPPHIEIMLSLLDDTRIACEHLHIRRPNSPRTQAEIVEELLAVIRRKAEEKPCRRIRID